MRTEPSARLLYIYGNNMLFACNKPIRLAGTADPGAKITMEVVLDGDVIIRTGFATALQDGSFEVETTGIEGGYTGYEIKVSADGVVFANLTGVVFGALWLASGQSNMQYKLADTYEGFALSKTGGTEEYIRALDIPSTPEYNGSGVNLPFKALRDIKGASWCKGTDTAKILKISAVAYFFACELRKELDMPVGILNASLGGSSIYTWLSREAIDSTPAVKDYLASTGRYIAGEQWDSVKHSAFEDMTANYNKKIEPLGRFEPDGMIWYQGESNIGESYGAYTSALNLLHKSYSKLFGYEGSSMPLICSQLASFSYGHTLESYNLVGNFNIQLGEIQTQNPAAIAMVSIYDVSLDADIKKIDKSFDNLGAIHPMVKKPVGEKMAFAALGLVYKRRSCYSAPVISSTLVENNSILVKLNNTGDGLSIKPLVFKSYAANPAETPLYGFSIAGANGIYVEAKAEIVAPDTVRIWNDAVESPVSAAYAFSLVNGYSNLFATENGKFTLAASPFITKRIDGAGYVQDKYWTTCDIDRIWRETDEPYFAPAYKAYTGNTNLSFSFTEKAAGTAALQVDYTVQSAQEKSFAFGPELTYNKDQTPTAFPGINCDYSANSTVSFKVKNTSYRPVSFDEMRFYTTVNTWYSPRVAGTGYTMADVPADGQWHSVTLDLTKLCLSGDAEGAVESGNVINNVLGIELWFSDETAMSGNSGTIYVDDFQFAPIDNAG